MKEEITKKTDLRSFINSDKVRAEITKALPSICTPERFLRVSMTAVTKNPKLGQCEQASFISCLLDCAQLGIEPDGRRAHLIPFNNNKKGTVECQLIIDYKGLVELVMRSGKVANVHADKVCKNDTFIYDTGNVSHKIDFAKDRGEVYCYYAKATFKDGSTKCEVMTVAEVEAIRQSSQGKNGTPWLKHFDEMGKKTVFKRLSKWLPLSPEEAQVLQRVDEKEFAFDMPQAGKELPKPDFVAIDKETVISAIQTTKSEEDLQEVMKNEGAKEFALDEDVKETVKAQQESFAELK